MAKPYKKAGKYYLRYRDETGRWRDRVTPATTITEAKRLGAELDQQVWRIREGLESAKPARSLTLNELASWWLKTHSAGKASHSRNESYVRVHVYTAAIAPLPASQVTCGMVEEFLSAKERDADLAARTLNHLRGFLHAIFESGLRAGLIVCKNPVADVRRRRVPKRLPDYLKPHEVPLMLNALADRWRPLFATAVFTGMRKGELLGLLKSDVDRQAMRIQVCRSYDRDTTKSGDDGAIPIATELLPYLDDALAASKGTLVFPGLNGEMAREDTKLEQVLRRALARAGIVESYTHVCRFKGCGHSESHTDGDLRHCPAHKHKLWPKPVHRMVRFHDLRHTTASLLIMAGADMSAVQRILRHSDPRMTMGTYVHLAPGYLRDQIDRLSFVKAEPIAAPELEPVLPPSQPEPVLESPRPAGPRTSESALDALLRLAAPVLQDH